VYEQMLQLYPDFKISSLSRVVPQWENNVPVVYEAMDDFGDLKKDAMFGSECSCRLFVYVWGVSVVYVRRVGVSKTGYQAGSARLGLARAGSLG